MAHTARRLDKKVAIVTGGATGIGEAISHKFAREGARVIVAGLPDDPVDDVVRRIVADRGDAIGFRGDLSTETDAQQCVQAAIDHYGRLDVLVNNAGVFLFTGETQDYPVHAFDATVRNNVRSMFLMTKYALPHLQKSHGNIIAAGSEAGVMGEPFNTPYGGTKGWVHSFIRGVAYEQAAHSVRANCVLPGPIDTAWTHPDTGPMTKKMEKQTLEATVMGRRGTPEEVANVYAFLASDEASYVTGALWTVDGGTTIAKGPAGLSASRAFRREPDTELPLTHSRDGLANKEIHSSM